MTKIDYTSQTSMVAASLIAKPPVKSTHTPAVR